MASNLVVFLLITNHKKLNQWGVNCSLRQRLNMFTGRREISLKVCRGLTVWLPIISSESFADQILIIVSYSILSNYFTKLLFARPLSRNKFQRRKAILILIRTAGSGRARRCCSWELAAAPIPCCVRVTSDQVYQKEGISTNKEVTLKCFTISTSKFSLRQAVSPGSTSASLAGLALFASECPGKPGALGVTWVTNSASRC